MHAIPNGSVASTALDNSQQRYTLRKKIRAHTNGKPEVWLARDKRLGCEVVLKKYVGEALAPAWEAEAKLLALALPQLPRLFDALVLEDGTCLLIREYLPGTSLSDLAAPFGGNAANTENISHILKCVARAARLTHALHSAKPQPVSLSPNVSASDFIFCETGAHFAPRLLPSYFPAKSPILVPDVRGDVAQLGNIAIELLRVCGQHLASVLPVLPEAVTEVLSRATHADPEQRHASALWLAQALEEAAVDCLAWFPESVAALPEVHAEAHLVEASGTLVNRLLRSGRFSPDLALAHASHELSDMIGVGDDPDHLIALESLECDHYLHQIQTVQKVIASPEMRSGAILSDEVGLGKTIEALLICQELRARGMANSVLIIASPSGATQWLSECSRRMRRENSAAPEFHLYSGERDLNRSLLIISSAALRRSTILKQLTDTRRDDLVIVDEAHQCCRANSGGSLSPLGAAVASLRRKRLLLLTATPMISGPVQLATLAHLIEPGLIDPALVSGIDGDESDAASVARRRVLRARLQSVMVRHRRAELAESVPMPNIAVRRISVEGQSDAAKLQVAAGLICGDWRRERVVAFCRSSRMRAALAAELQRRMPGRAVIQFQGGRREQRLQESRFAEFADAVMIAGDKIAEGMNWQRARCLVHLDVPLSPLAWEQRVGRIMRLGQRAVQLDVVHLATPGDHKALDLYEHALGLFTLPIGEAANALDLLPRLSIDSLERAIRASLSLNGLSQKRYQLMAAELRRARGAYDQQTTSNKLLDEFYSADWPHSAVTQKAKHFAENCQSRLNQLAECVHRILDSAGIERRETKPGSSVYMAKFANDANQAALARILIGSGQSVLLYTFDAARWESGSRVQLFTQNSTPIKNLCAWALATCSVVEAHASGVGTLEPYFTVHFTARFDGIQARETTEWLAINLSTRQIKRLKRCPLQSESLRPGAAPAGAFQVLPEMLAVALDLLCARFNADAAATLEQQRQAEQMMLAQSLNSINLSKSSPTGQTVELSRRLERQAALRLETAVLGGALLWLPEQRDRPVETTV